MALKKNEEKIRDGKDKGENVDEVNLTWSICLQVNLPWEKSGYAAKRVHGG